ncbi:MAG: hypothetical protein HN849_15050 [Victivallales bacterium]|jgi:hypothetical protein|nr:hypothetical protein [Victivallales bacterium]MBT7300835.1 hypothetical protein [Victivallales bacterium]
MKARTKRILLIVLAALVLTTALVLGLLVYLAGHPKYGGSVLCAQNLYALTPCMASYQREHDGNAPPSIGAFREYCISAGGQLMAQCFVCPNDETGEGSYEMAISGKIDPSGPRLVLIRERVARHGGQRRVMNTDGSIVSEGG